MKTYESCIKSKPGVKRSAFHLDYEAHIDKLAREILARRYHPGRSNIFVVFHPKPREIIAAHIRDRIVHHYIYEYMAPYWEPRFSDRSFACRPERGPLHAVKELRRFISSYQRHSMKPLYDLKVDIASFFPSIDLHILRKLIFRKLTHPLISYLVDVTLKHRPVAKGNFILNSPKWRCLRSRKALIIMGGFLISTK
jgi:retron-type reverse transcriptase